MDKKREKYIMENEKNEMKKKPGKVLPWLAAVLLAAALAARAAVPVPAGLFMQIWNIGTQLIILFSGLVLFSAAARAVFQRVSPSSNHGKTVFTLADSAIRYLLIIVGLLWALSIVGVDVRALLAGAGVLALIIDFGADTVFFLSPLVGIPDLKFAALADKNRRVGNAGVLQQLFAQHDAPGTVKGESFGVAENQISQIVLFL
jgi:hypothetical protein